MGLELVALGSQIVYAVLVAVAADVGSGPRLLDYLYFVPSRKMSFIVHVTSQRTRSD